MKILAILAGLLLTGSVVAAAEMAVPVHLVSADGVGKEIGTIAVMDTKYGLLLRPNLSELPPGLHGFHVHEHPSCEAAKKDEKMVAAHSAGGHYDPAKTGKHEGPYSEGHLGDLPPLFSGSDGKVSLPVLAPRLKADDLKGRALMVHAGGDNYSDTPEPLGGGGARIACGVVK